MLDPWIIEEIRRREEEERRREDEQRPRLEIQDDVPLPEEKEEDPPHERDERGVAIVSFTV